MHDSTRSTVEQILAEWRAAERQLEELTDDAPSRPARLAEVERLRVAYQRAVLTAQHEDTVGHTGKETTRDRAGTIRP